MMPIFSQVLRYPGDFYRHHRGMLLLLVILLSAILIHSYLLPCFISDFYLPALWDKYDMGHLECQISSIGFRSLEFRNLYFWDERTGEGSINRGTIRYRLNPWGMRSFIEIESVTLYGFHATASYYHSHVQLHGLNMWNIQKPACNSRNRAQLFSSQLHSLKIKNSHIDLLFAGHRLHLPFTMESYYLPSEKNYQIIGYLAPRGEYSIIKGTYSPTHDSLKLILKNENINMGCFNDFIPTFLHHQNVIGRLNTVCSIHPRRKFIADIAGEFMTGKAAQTHPNFSAYFRYEGKEGQEGHLNFHSRMRMPSGTYTLYAQNTRLNLKFPYLNCKGILFNEFFPEQKQGPILLPEKIIARTDLNGYVSLVNHKWALNLSGAIEQGLTALHQDLGRLICSTIRYEADFSGSQEVPPRFRGSFTIPLLGLQNNGINSELQKVSAVLSNQAADGLQLTLNSENFKHTFSSGMIQGNSLQGKGILSPGHRTLKLQGDITHLHQKYQNHEIITPLLHYQLQALTGTDNIRLNISTRNTILQSKIHNYFTDCLELNWNWLFKPDGNQYGPNQNNYLRCQNFRLSSGQTAALNLTFRQQNTTACWKGKIQTDLSQPDSIIDLLADLHWPEWKQFPFITTYATIPRKVLNQSPTLQNLLSNIIIPPQHPEQAPVSVWLDSTWFNGKMRMRTGYAGPPLPPPAVSNQNNK